MNTLFFNFFRYTNLRPNKPKLTLTKYKYDEIVQYNTCTGMYISLEQLFLD